MSSELNNYRLRRAGTDSAWSCPREMVQFSVAFRGRRHVRESETLNTDTTLHPASKKTKIGLGLGALVLAIAALAVEMKFDVVRNLVSGPSPGFTSPTQPEKASTRAAIVDVSKGFASVSKQVEGAVVNISSEQVVQTSSQQEEMFRRFFGDQGPFGNVPRSRRRRVSVPASLWTLPGMS